MNLEDIPQGNEIQPVPAVITVLGGDARLWATACRLAETVCTVRTFAGGEGSAVPDTVGGRELPISPCRSFREAWAGSRVMVLPLPVTRDGENVWCPLSPDRLISLDELTRAVARTAENDAAPPMIFGGKIPPSWREALTAAGGRVQDYLDNEDVCVRNAQITAEGAVMTAMEMMDVTILDAPVAVLGYGRIGQLLARNLLALRARVTVFARRAESRAWAISDGAAAAPMSDLPERAGMYAVIFNTVPDPVITEAVSSRMKEKAVIIDLASPPGGLSPEAEKLAATRGHPRILHALSLPGRYAPTTAGQVIADSILEAITHRPETASADRKEGTV